MGEHVQLKKHAARCGKLSTASVTYWRVRRTASLLTQEQKQLDAYASSP